MHYLRGRLDVAVPLPTLVEDRLPEFPHGVMVNRKIPGTPPTTPSKALAENVASVLRQLHSIGFSSVVPEREVLSDELAALVRTARAHVTKAQIDDVERWQAEFGSFLDENPPRCVVHGDFWHANWITADDGRTLTGLVDFERTHIGLFQVDLAPLRYFGERFRLDVIEAYCAGTDRDSELLVGQMWMFDVLREVRGLDWAIRNPDANEVEDAVEKVRDMFNAYSRSA